MPLDGLFHEESSPSTLYEGKIVTSADSVYDEVEVTLEAFSNDAPFSAPWMPRIDDEGFPVLPTVGDRCIAAYGESDHPGTPLLWVVAWWPTSD